MKKISLPKSWIILTSICGLGTGLALACAGDWGPEYGTSNFTPEVFVDTAYSPFFYSSNFYYGIGHDESQDTRFNTGNITDWSGYFSQSIPKEELQYTLEKASASSIDSANAWLNGKSSSTPLSMSSFHLLQNKSDKKVQAFFRYLRLAKQCEAFAVNGLEYSWDYGSKKSKPSIDATGLNKELMNGLTTGNDPFLKQRYWFQLERSYFFNRSPKDVIALFSTYEKQFPAGPMYYRCLSYMAGAWYKLKDYTKANYYYSRVYDGCNTLKTVAHYSFHPQEEKDWQGTLALCHNNDEQATLWQMLGVFYGDEKRAIGEIYRLNPRSEKLDLLLARAVNSAEQRFNSHDGPTKAKPNTPDSLSVLVTRIADAGNTGKPWIWQLAAGYLNMLNGKYKNAGTYYSRAEKLLPQEKLPQAQFRLLKLLNKIASTTTINASLENELRPEIEWLLSFNSTTEPQFRYADAFDWLKKTMAAKYKAQHALVRSECFSSNSYFYLNDHNVEDMKAFLEKPAKTPYEDLCVRLSVIKAEDLYEYQAIRLAQADKIDEAIAKMGQITTTTELLGNPFNGRIQDCHDCDHAAPQKVKYTKLSFLRKLKEIKDKAASGQDAYTNAVLLGNAFYNITHYGNARVFYECKIMGSGQSEPFIIDSAFRSPLTDMTMATKYYTMALNAAQTDEQKAKCQYMLAKCERNEWYNRTIYSDIKNQYGAPDRHQDFIAWKGFQSLKQYSNTQYYKDVIRECGYFKTYISK
jgi:hypothetical protein